MSLESRKHRRATSYEVHRVKLIPEAQAASSTVSFPTERHRELLLRASIAALLQISAMSDYTVGELRCCEYGGGRPASPHTWYIVGDCYRNPALN